MCRHVNILTIVQCTCLEPLGFNEHKLNNALTSRTASIFNMILFTRYVDPKQYRYTLLLDMKSDR